MDLYINRLKKIINTDYLNFIKKDQTNYTNTLITDIPHLISSISFLLTIFVEFTILIFIISLIFYINFQISSLTFVILFFGILIYILFFKNKLSIISNIRKKLELERMEFLSQVFMLT